MSETNQSKLPSSKSADQRKATTEISSPISIRVASQADVSFIFNSWLKSYQSTCKHVAAPVYFEFHHKLIEAILQRSTVLIAANSTDDSQIYAYLVYEHIDDIPVLHYAYTKHTYRQIGVQSKLLKHASININEACFITHKTQVCSKLAAKGLVYNPYLAHKVL